MSTKPGQAHFALSSLCFAFTTAYHFSGILHRQYFHDLFSFPVWRAMAWTFLVADPIGFVACLLGPVVLVRTYSDRPPRSE